MTFRGGILLASLSSGVLVLGRLDRPPGRATTAAPRPATPLARWIGERSSRSTSGTGRSSCSSPATTRLPPHGEPPVHPGVVSPRDPRPGGPDPPGGRDTLPTPRLRRRAADDRHLPPVVVPTDPTGRRGHRSHGRARPDHRRADRAGPVGDGTDARPTRRQAAAPARGAGQTLADSRTDHTDRRDHVAGSPTAGLLKARPPSCLRRRPSPSTQRTRRPTSPCPPANSSTATATR